PPHLHIRMSDAAAAKYVRAYAEDPAFREKWADAGSADGQQFKGQCFIRGANDLLFFRINDEAPRLCIPRSEVTPLLARIHDSPFEAAHEG
ncbi:hypothetical protein FA95DRAFT_1458593, partial [Auriscalpium vulgare]